VETESRGVSRVFININDVSRETRENRQLLTALARSSRRIRGMKYPIQARSRLQIYFNERVAWTKKLRSGIRRRVTAPRTVLTCGSAHVTRARYRIRRARNTRSTRMRDMHTHTRTDVRRFARDQFTARLLRFRRCLFFTSKGEPDGRFGAKHHFIRDKHRRVVKTRIRHFFQHSIAASFQSRDRSAGSISIPGLTERFSSLRDNADDRN